MRKIMCFLILSSFLLFINYFGAIQFKEARINWEIMPYIWNGIFVIFFFIFIRLVDLIPALIIILCCSFFNQTIGMRIAVIAYKYPEWIAEQDSIITWLLIALLKVVRTIIILFLGLLILGQINSLFEFIKKIRTKFK